MVIFLLLLKIYQYAHCVKDRLGAVNMTDVAIYVDVWRSLNGRFQQRSIHESICLRPNGRLSGLLGG